MSSREDQTGLRLRIDREARRISSQHRQLDVFYERVIHFLTGGDAARARAEFLRLCDALEAHFTVEERMHFPALHGLRPELDAELAGLVEEHKAFRSALEAITGHLQGSELGRASAALDRLVVDLAAHEGREEKMAEQLDRSPGETR